MSPLEELKMKTIEFHNWLRENWPEVTVEGRIYRRAKSGHWLRRTPHPGKEGYPGIDGSWMHDDHDWLRITDPQLLAKIELAFSRENKAHISEGVSEER